MEACPTAVRPARGTILTTSRRVGAFGTILSSPYISAELDFQTILSYPYISELDFGTLGLSLVLSYPYISEQDFGTILRYP